MGRHGENIRKRKDGRWEARILSGYDTNNKARYYSIYGRTYAEVKEKRMEWIRKTGLEKPTPPSPNNPHKITVTQLANEWLCSKKDIVKESTYVHYSRIVHNHIVPELGNYHISALTTNIIDSFLRKKLHTGNLETGGPLSPKTVTDIRSVILQILEYAQIQNYPCGASTHIFCPRSTNNHIKVFSLEEQRSLESLLYYNTTPFKLGVLVTLYSGLRIGEICALQWKDIYLKDGTLHISKTIIRIQDTNPFSERKTKLMITHPKTDTSHRIIPIPSFILEHLKANEQPPEYFLLTGTLHPFEPRSCLSKYKRLLRSAGLKSYTFHTLRHTFATRCIENGFDAKSLSEILGHASVSTTLQRYVHPSLELKRTQMEKLQNLTIH